MRPRAILPVFVSIIALLPLANACAAVADSITINVAAGARQQFGGLGFNLINQTPVGWPTNASSQKTFIQNMITQSRFRNIVLWGDGWITSASATSADTSQVSIIPMVSDVLTWSQQAGVDFIMINPTQDRPLATHVTFWTQCAKMLRNRGININAMTFLNKANTGQNGQVDSGKKRREPADVVAGVKLLRSTLNSLGMADVRICSPTIVEWHPRTWWTYGDRYDFSDGDTAAYINALTADPAALAAIDALDMQTYGTGVGDWASNIARSNNKEMWVSLSATDAPKEWDANLPDGKNSAINGPILAATCLSDLNHGVSRWNFWVMYNLVRNASATAPQYYGRFHYMSDISTRFDKGAMFRRCTSDRSTLPTPDMRWNYNRADSLSPILPLQPDIVAAAARNPDSTWAVGIVNISSIRSQHKASDDLGIARTYRVTVNVAELQGIDSLAFTVGKCNDVTGIKDGGTVTMRGGSMTLSLDSKELVMLRSAKVSTPALPATRVARVSDGLSVRSTAVRGVFEVGLTSLDKPATITVVAMNGRTVFAGTGLPGTRGVVDLRHSPAGTYIVSVASASRTMRDRIVIK